jgi:hypothetical protein
MIEFKADCGHTIRAKDQDEGKVVRCSYCGREMQVPVNEPDDLDSLFAEVEASESHTGGAVSRKTRRAMRRQAPGGTTQRSTAVFNPFAVALKMAYVAAILIVMILVGRYVYQNWSSFDFGGGSKTKKVVKEGGGRDRDSGGRKSRGLGLLTTRLNRKHGGIYINSVPAGALVRVRKREPDQGRPSAVAMFGDPDLETYKTNKAVELKAGRYDVVVAVRVSDPHLMVKYPGYKDLRRKIDQGKCTPALLDGFFMPDGASRAGTLELANVGALLYRQYERDVVGTDWTPLTSLFLPYGSPPNTAKYLPRKDSFGFDETYVTGELDYHGVPKRDQKTLIDVLRRVGLAVYQIPGERVYRCFSVNLSDGSIVYTTCEDPRPPSGGSAVSGSPVGRSVAGSP